MGENSKIEWTDSTFNPWVGCAKISAGCAHCYAETLMDKRMGKVQWGPQGTRVVTSPANWRKPEAWNRKAAKAGVRHKVFCASLADVFEDHQSIKPEWRAGLLDLIEITPNLDWLLLTKRPENVMQMIHDEWQSAFPSNVWIGTTVENQAAADKRIPELLKIPARVRFLSVEPMVGPVDLGRWIYTDGGPWKSDIDWVICGGESGPDARPMHPDWAMNLRDQCVASGVPFFFKQWGEWKAIAQMTPEEHDSVYYPHETDCVHLKVRVPFVVNQLDGKPRDEWGKGAMTTYRVGKKSAGRMLDGRTWDEVPK